MSRIEAYSVFSVLRWIQEHTHTDGSAPGAEENMSADRRHTSGRRSKLEQALAEIREKYPDFEDSSHPDFHIWRGESGQVAPLSIIPVEEFISLINSDTTKALEIFLSAPDASPLSDFWYDAKHSISMLTTEDTKASLKLLAALIEDRSDILDNHRKFVVVEAVLEAFGSISLDCEQFEQLRRHMRILPDMLDTSEAQRIFKLQRTFKLWAEIIRRQVSTARDSLDIIFHRNLRGAATDLWKMIISNPIGPVVTDEISPPTWDPLMDAINHAVGVITQFWMESIAIECSQARAEWSGLPQDVRSHLEDMLNAPREASRMVEVILVTRLQLLDSADSAWTEKHVLPLLDFEISSAANGQPDSKPQDDRAWRCWSAYLYWGKPNNRLLEAGLDRMYLEVTRRVCGGHPDQGSEPSPLGRSAKISLLRSHLLGICMYFDQLIRKPEWLLELTSALSNENRVLFICAMSETFTELDDNAINQVWDGWLKQYWQQRLQGIPDQLQSLEAGAFAELTVKLGSNTLEAIRMSCERPASLRAQNKLLYNLNESEIVEKNPDEIARLLLHLCEHTDADWNVSLWSPSRRLLGKLVRRLHGRASDELVGGIINRAMELGCADAHSWLSTPANSTKPTR